MKTAYSIIAAILLCFVSAEKSASQSSITVIPTITEADIINATSLVDPFQEKIKDIAPTTFSLNIFNNTQPREVVKVKIDIQALVTLDEDRQEKLLTKAFIRDSAQPEKGLYWLTIPPTGKLFTSKDANSPDIDADNYPGYPTDLKDKLKKAVQDPASGGRVPSGTYRVIIQFTVVKVGDKIVNESVPVIDRTVTVTNPTTATLLIPSDNGYEYSSPFPQFQWINDTRSVMISVYEKRPEHQSLEDAISAADPFLQVKIDRRESGNLTILTYPQAATPLPGVEYLRTLRPLERGKTYVIVLDGLRTAFGYTVEPIRTIRSFRIVNQQTQVQSNIVVNILNTTIGTTGKFQSALDKIRNEKLSLSPNDPVRFNGLPLSEQDLQLLLNQNKDKIKSIRWEE